MNSSSAENLGASRQLLRHTVATLAYRGGKVLRGAPVEFAEFRVAETTRTPGQILAHLGDLLDWALSMADGTGKWHKSNPSTWDEGIQRFFTSLTALDQYLASNKPLHCPVESLFQGPIADALTHVGQIAMLRRLANVPIRGENYFVAEIVVGRTGDKQAEAKREFD